MEPNFKVKQNFLKLILFITLFIEITTKSVPLSWQSNSCASSCVSDPFMLRYDSGKTYYYSFETSSHLSIQDYQDNDQPLVISGQMELSSYDTCELGLQLSDVRINGLSNEQQFSIKQSLESNPIMFGLSDGRIVGVCPSLDDQDYVIDIKKSLIGSLQMTARSPNDRTVVMETDILGDCETEYIPKLSYYRLPAASIVMQKKKVLNDCSRRQQSMIGLFPQAFGVNEVLSRQTAPLMNATLTCTQILDYDMITSVTCEETQTPSVWLRQQATPNVMSTLKIKFLKQATGLSTRRLATESIARHVLKMSEKKDKINSYSNRKYEESDVTKLFRDLCQKLETSEAGKGGGARHIQKYFPELVQSLQQINDLNVFKRIDQSLHDKQFCAENENVLYDLWLDALTLSATEPGLQILVNSVNEISSLKSSYLFSLLAFSSDPNVGAVRSLLPLLENKSSSRQVILGISSFIRNLREKEPHVSDDVLNRATEALIARVQSQARASVPIDAIASLKALENVLDRYSAQSRAQSVLLELAQDSGLDNGVRSAAISALVRIKSDENAWNDVIEHVIKDTRVSLELRINAYKSAVTSGLNGNQLKKILELISNSNENEKQFSNYVKTHMKSIHESSDPFKRDLIPRDGPVFPKPEFDSIFDFSKSRNIEYSYLNSRLSSGFVIESDLIFDNNNNNDNNVNRIPSSVTFNTSIPFFGKQLQLIEITFRQNGFNNIIENAFKNKNQNYFNIFNEIIESFKSNSNSNQNQNENVLKKLVKNLKLNQNSNQNFAQIFIKFDGKSIFVFDLINDFENFFELFSKIKQQYSSKQELSRAIALVLSDTRVRIPTLTGIPIELNLNASLAASIKANVQMNDRLIELGLRPSVSAQMSGGIGLSIPSAQRGLVYVGEAWSSPVIDFKIDSQDKRIWTARVNIPEQKQSIFGLKLKQSLNSKQLNNELNGNNDNDNNAHVNNKEMKGCSKVLSKAFGLELCSKMSFPKLKSNSNGNQFEIDITLEKSDQSLKSYEFSIEVPRDSQSNAEMRVWRVSFNTPNSQVNREMALEFVLNRPPQGKQEAKVSLKSPWKQIQASIALRNEDKERSVQLEVLSDGSKVISIDVGVQQQTRGQKKEFRPRLKIQVQGNEPIVLQGSVSVSRGRKNSIQISLEGPEAGKQFLKGQFIREGEKRSNDWRVSSDVALQVPEMIEFRVLGVLDKGIKKLSTDLTFEYKFGKQMKKKENIKISMKAQNLTQSSLKKMSGFAEMTSSQYPDIINAQIAYNLLSKSNEHFENELSLSWSQQLKKKLRLLQVMKVLSNSSKVENTLNVEFTPLNVDYEMRANVEKANSKPLKYSIELIGKDKKGNKQNDVKANVEYKHVTEQPLHVSLKMNAKSGSGYEVSYSDELKEIANGEFKGHTSVKWDKDKEASLDYMYKTKSNERNGIIHHELETELMTPHKSPFPMKHSGLLRMTRDGFEVKSRAHANGRQLYALESVRSYNNPEVNSHFALDVSNVGRGRLEVNPYSVPRVASLDVVLPRYSDFEHKSNFELNPHDESFSLNSQTKRAQQNLFALDSHFARDSPARVVITSQPLNARVNYHPIERTLEVNANSPEYDLSHVSTLTANPVSRVIALKSTTKRNLNPLLEIDSEFAPKHKSFVNVNVARVGALAFDANLTPRAQRNANLVIKSVSGAEHNSKLLWGKSGTKFVSTSVDRNLNPVLSIDYNHNPEDSRHTLNVDTNEIESQLNAQLAPYSNDNAVKFALKSGARAPHKFSHETEVKVNSNAIQIASQTKNRNENIASIDATLARQYTRQPSNVRVNVLNTRSNIALNPLESAKFEYNNPSIVDHVTQFDYKPSESSYSLLTRSRTPNANQYNLNGQYSRDSQSIATQLPSFDASFQFIPQSKSAKFEFIGKRANNAYNHVTEMELNPQKYLLTSRTDRQLNGQNVLSLDGLLANKKSIAVKYLDGPHASEAKVVVANDGRAINVFGRHQQYTHASDLEIQDKSVKIKSRTDFEPLNQNLNKIDANITFNPYVTGSHVTFVSPKLFTSVNHSPSDRNAKFELRTQSIEHQTSLAHNPREQQYQLKSLTVNANDKQRLFELNSSLAPKRVNFALESPGLVNSNLVVSNLNGKNAQFELNAQRIPRVFNGLLNAQTFAHKTDASLNNENEFVLNSQTSMDARVFNKINARLNQPNNVLSFETPSFVARSQYQNIASPRVELEYRSKHSRGRHVLASIEGGVGNGNGVEVDIAWDKQNDPNNRLVLTLNVERNRNSNSLLTLNSVSNDLVSMTINYKQNEMKFLSEMNSHSLLMGPHAFTLSWKPQSGDVVQLTANHNWNFRDRQLNCQTTYSVGGVLQFSAKFEAKATPNNVYIAHVITSSPNDNAFDYDFGVEARVVNQNELKAKVWANNGASKTAKANLEMTRDSYQRIYKGDLTLQVNGVDERRVAFNADLNERLIEADVYAFNTKQLALVARASEQAISLNLMSNVQHVPSLKALASLDVERRALVITLEKNAIRVFDLSAKMTGSFYSNDLNSEFRITNPLFSISANAKRLSGHVSAGTEFVVNDRTVFSAQLSAENQRNSANNWIAKGHIVANEAELARVSLEQSFGSNALQYALRASSYYAREFSPLSVVIAKKAQSRDREYSIEICAKADASQCLRTQIDIQLSDTRYHNNNIQQIVIKVSKPETDVQFEYALNAQQKLNEGSRYEQSLLDTRAGQTYKTYGARRSALVFTVNAHSLGAELLIPERSRQGFDGSLKLLFPSSRVITTRADIAYTNVGLVAKADIKNVNDVFLSLNADVRQRNDLSARFELNSKKFNRNPKVLSFVSKQWTRERPFDIRIEADVSSNQNNALVFESFSTFNSNTNNRTLSLNVNSRDKQIDFSSFGHVAIGHSIGLKWNNVNRNGIQSNGFYFAEKDIQNAFNVIINDHYRIRAQISDNYLDSTWTLFDIRRNIESGQLRVQLADSCALFEVSRDSLSPASSLRVCLEDNQRHLLIISTEVKQNANSIITSKLEFDSRSEQKTMRFSLDWNRDSVARVLKQIVQNNDWSPLTSRVVDSEIYREFSHKFEHILNVISRDIVYPLMTVLSDEFEDILQEMSQHFPPIVSLIERVSINYKQLVIEFNRIYSNIRDVITQFIRQFTPTVITDAIKQWSRVVSRAVRNTCIRNSNTCYQYVYAFERYGFEGIVQLSLQKVYESARQTHRFAMTTMGRLSKTFAELRNTQFWPNFDFVWDTRVGQYVLDYTRAVIIRFYDSLNNIFERIINENEDLRQILNAFRRIVIELSREFESIEWTRVRNALNDAIKAILTPESSSTRVLLWDPHNGRIMLEVRAPVIRRRLRAIMVNDNHAYSFIDSVQSWLSDTFKDTKDKQKKQFMNKDIKNITRALWSEWRLIHTNDASSVTRVYSDNRDALSFMQTRVFELRAKHNLTSLEIIDRTRAHNTARLFSVDTRSLVYWTHACNDDDTCARIRVSFEANSIHVIIDLNSDSISMEFNAKRRLLSIETNDEIHALYTIVGDVTPFLEDHARYSTCRRWLSRASTTSNTTWWSPWLREQSARDACQSSQDLCDFSSILAPRVPHECLKCYENEMEFGFGFRKHVNTRPFADVLFVIGCQLNDRFQTQIKRLAKQMSREFRSRDVSTRFMALIGNGSKQIQIWPKFEKQLDFHSNSNPVIESTNHSLSFDWLSMTSLPFRTESTRHVIIWSCNECVERNIDFVSARVHILSTPTFVHVISNGKRVLNRRSKKWRQVIGCDHEWAYLSNGQRSRELRDHAFPPKDVCVSVAMETNGSFWMRRNTREWRQTVAARVADNTLVDACVSCDCVETRDRMTAHFDCRLCDTRVHTVKQRKHVSINDQSVNDYDDMNADLDQQWNEEEDEREDNEEEEEIQEKD